MRSSTSTATFAPARRRAQRLVREVEPPRRLGGDGEQLRVVRRLGQSLGGEPQRREREPLLEVPGSAPPGDRRHLVVAAGTLGVVGERRVVEHRRPPHRLEARSCRRRRSRPSSWWTMASATRAWENQNWSSLTSTTTPGVDERPEVGEQLGLVGLGDGEQGLERGRPPVHGERLDDAAADRARALRPAGGRPPPATTAARHRAGRRRSRRGPTTRISSSTTNGMPPLRRCSASMNADDALATAGAARSP